jgi:hypothetical protein
VTRRALALLLTTVLVGSCNGNEVTAPTVTNAPSPSARTGLCQPFPDRLIDDLVTAYNSRDLERLGDLVTAPHVEDVVAAAYHGDAFFDDVEEWAEVAWDAGDRLSSVGYSAFHPTKRGF